MDHFSYIEDMSFDSLQNLRNTHPAWKLLTATSAPMIVSFLYQAFVVENRRELPEYSLVSHLNTHLERLGEVADGKERLTLWSDDNHGFLRKFYPADSDEVHYDLTSSAQKAIEWIDSLHTQRFTATESRLLLVFQLFHEIAERSHEDPERRIRDIERRKAELEDELMQVMKGHVRVLEPAQIKERYLQAMSLSREILADFRAVEQNFRDLRREMQERISSWDKGKGALIGDFFHDQEGIEQSDQGRSFQAFFDFLMSKAAQDNFEETIRTVGALDAVRELPSSRNTHRIIRDWVEGSKHVQDTLTSVSEQLRRYVDENFVEEERRINMLMKDILSAAVSLRATPPAGAFSQMDALSPDITLPFDRPLFTPAPTIEMDEQVLTDGIANEGDDSTLYTHISINKAELQQHIESLLQDNDEVTLVQVTNAYPIKYGLAELIGYLSIAQERAVIQPSVSEPVLWQDADGNVHKADFSRIIYRRNEKEQMHNG